MNASNTNTKTNTDDLTVFVAMALAYASAIEQASDLKAKAENLREQMLPILKAHEKEEWKTLGKKIKAALVAAKVSDINGKLGVFKTCFEYKIMPTTFNADRLRKMKTWVAWSGFNTTNKYEAKHVQKPTAITADMPVSALPAQDAPTAKGKPKVPAGNPVPAKPSSSVTADGTGSADALKPSELWNSQYQAWVHNPLTPAFIETLAALLVVEKSKLTAAMTTAASDLLKQAAKQNV